MIRRSLFGFVLAFLPTGLAHAQVTFTAILEKATVPSICQEETHVVACNGTKLKSTTLDLNGYLGKPYRFTAVPAGVTCLIWNVTSVGPAEATLTHCGSAVPGCPMRLVVGPTGPLGQWFLWYSTTSAFQPLDPVSGTLMLGPPYLFAGTGYSAGTSTSFDFVMPSLPALVGLEIFAQGANMAIGPAGPLHLSNPTCFSILPPMPPCIQPGC